jgi:hypothetical protein
MTFMIGKALGAPLDRVSVEIAKAYCSTKVRAVAKEFAGIFYDGALQIRDGDTTMQRSARFRAAFPSQREYVRTQWPYFLGLAREHMTTLLTMEGVAEPLKNEVYEGLLEDHEKRRQLRPDRFD